VTAVERAQTISTGDEMIVWGGVEPPLYRGDCRLKEPENYVQNGAIYNPRTNKWRKIPPGPLDLPSVAGRDCSGFTALWAGTRMAVLVTKVDPDSASSCSLELEAYDPVTNKWTRLPANPETGGPVSQALWAGSQLFV
jgi:hypothetical protein